MNKRLKGSKQLYYQQIDISKLHRYEIILFHQAQPRTNNLDKLETPENFRHPRGGHVKPGGHTALYIFILRKLMYVYLMSIDTFKTLPLK